MLWNCQFGGFWSSVRVLCVHLCCVLGVKLQNASAGLFVFIFIVCSLCPVSGKLFIMRSLGPLTWSCLAALLGLVCCSASEQMSMVMLGPPPVRIGPPPKPQWLRLDYSLSCSEEGGLSISRWLEAFLLVISSLS